MDRPLGTRQPVRSRYSQYRPVTMSLFSVLLVFLGIGAVNAGTQCQVCVDNSNYCDPTWLPNPNLNLALTGVDIAKKHPMPFKPEENPSVKDIIFNPTYRDEVKGNMAPFDYLQTIDKIVCSTNFETVEWKTTEQYIKGSTYSSMSRWSLGYEGPTVSGKLEIPEVGEINISMPPNTASIGGDNTETNEDIRIFYSVEKGSISHSHARCSVYTVKVDIDNPSLIFHTSFIEAIKDIDKAKTENEKNFVMEKFFSKFGSHYASKSIMGVGVLFETRYTEEETLRHNTEERNECSSRSGGAHIAGWGGDHSDEMCKGSLNDTTKGHDTIVKRFTSTTYGTFPAGKSLIEWSEQVEKMNHDGTLAPVPIQQELRLILDLFATPAVANITHNDGSKVNVTNLFRTALDGYNRYCSYVKCVVPDCANSVLIKGLGTFVFTQEKGQGINGVPIYKNFENLYLHYSINEGWIVSLGLTEIHMLKSSPCPQKGVEFQVTEYAIGNGPLPEDVNTWQDCAEKCFDHPNCKFWQHNFDTMRCSLISDYGSTQTRANVTTGTRDCPGYKSLFAHGLCVENMSSRSMWIGRGTTVFTKGIEVQAFDPTFLIIAGGHARNHDLNSVEIIIGNAECPIPDLPIFWNGANLVVTAGDRRVLYCGGTVWWNRKSDICYVLDVASGAWINHSGMSKTRPFSTSITMEQGVYIIGGHNNGRTSEYLPKSLSTWQTGPNVPYDFSGGCGVKISNDEFVIIGGRHSKKSVYSYSVETSKWTQRPDLIEERDQPACTLHTPSNSIIVAGGEGSLSTTEIIPLDTWRPRKAGDLKQGRFGHAMVTVGGKHPTVYAIGGYDGSSYISSVEVWDQLKAEWKMGPASLNIARSGHAALAVPPSVIC